MRGRSKIVTCYFCKKSVPQYKAIMSYKRMFSYRDDKYGVKYFGPTEKIWVCRSCARHRGIVDSRQQRNRQKIREFRSHERYGYIDKVKNKLDKELKEQNNKNDTSEKKTTQTN